MSAFANPTISRFASDVLEGLSAAPKHIAGRHLYDEIGMRLRDVISLLPECGFAAAQQRIQRRHAAELAERTGPRALTSEIADAPASTPANWLGKARWASENKPADQTLLLKLPALSLAGLEPSAQSCFLRQLSHALQPSGFFLFYADLSNAFCRTADAYDDKVGVTAAFNKNLLTRINRELGGHFDLRLFEHRATWNAFLRRVELHLAAREEHDVYIAACNRRFHFAAGESIRTELTHKFDELELEQLARQVGFEPVKTWMDNERGFAQVLWQAAAHRPG